MRILLYGINYAPEITGIGKYTAEMCEHFSAQGYTVHVITAMPYYPRWEKDTEYKGKWWHTEYSNGVKLLRCPLYVPKKITPIGRVFHEFSFIAASFPYWIKTFFTKKYDVVISISPPFHTGVLPLIYSKIRRVPLIVHIQDLQIDVAKGLKMLKNRAALKLMFAIERLILKSCAAVTTISLDMRMKIISKGLEASKCFYLPNWVDENKILPLTKTESLRKEFGINDSARVILFSGSLGEKHGLENMIECAKAFIHSPDVLFVIVGSGEGEAHLRASVRKLHLPNVLFFPLQVYDKLSALLAIADLHLILLKRIASDLVMPSKLTSVLAAGGVPIVTAAKDSSLYGIVTQNNMGIVVAPDDVNALIEGIRKGLATDLEPYSINARSYAEDYLSKSAIMTQWERKIINVIRHYHLPAHTPQIGIASVLKKNVEAGVSSNQ